MAACGVECPRRAISSARLAPVAAASTAPECLRSCQRRSSRPAAWRALYQCPYSVATNRPVIRLGGGAIAVTDHKAGRIELCRARTMQAGAAASHPLGMRSEALVSATTSRCGTPAAWHSYAETVKLLKAQQNRIGGAGMDTQTPSLTRGRLSQERTKAPELEDWKDN